MGLFSSMFSSKKTDQKTKDYVAKNIIQTIPYRKIYQNGIIELKERRFSEEFTNSVLLSYKDDHLDGYREDFNQMLIDKMAGTNNNLIMEFQNI